MQTKYISILFTFITVLVSNSFADGNNALRCNPDSLLAQARTMFYASIEDEDVLDSAIETFKKLAKQDQYKGKATTYIGALHALKGKHAFWPHKKFEHVNKGLKIMDQGLAIDSDNIESLFIHASTCYYLPFFFNRGDKAEQNFRKIIQLLPSQSQKYDEKLIENAIAFILENIELNEDERTTMLSVSELYDNQ